MRLPTRFSYLVDSIVEIYDATDIVLTLYIPIIRE